MLFYTVKKKTKVNIRKKMHLTRTMNIYKSYIQENTRMGKTHNAKCENKIQKT